MRSNIDSAYAVGISGIDASCDPTQEPIDGQPVEGVPCGERE
jgi:hypothetical protein